MVQNKGGEGVKIQGSPLIRIPEQAWRARKPNKTEETKRKPKHENAKNSIKAKKEQAEQGI